MCFLFGDHETFNRPNFEKNNVCVLIPGKQLQI